MRPAGRNREKPEAHTVSFGRGVTPSPEASASLPDDSFDPGGLISANSAYSIDRNDRLCTWQRVNFVESQLVQLTQIY
jgi:hypothetical protein